MALPLLPIVAVIANSTVKVVTNPLGVALVLGWVAISTFDLGIFADEVRRTVWSLWWVVVLVLLAWIAIAALPYLLGRRRTNSK